MRMWEIPQEKVSNSWRWLELRLIGHLFSEGQKKGVGEASFR